MFTIQSFSINKSQFNTFMNKVVTNIKHSIPTTPVAVQVYPSFRTKYLALEYGVAGRASPEKRQFSESGTVESNVVIPQATPRYFITKMGPKYGRYLKFFKKGRAVYFISGLGKKIRYLGVHPYLGRGIVRPLQRQLQNMVITHANTMLQGYFTKYKGRIPNTILHGTDTELYNLTVDSLNHAIYEAKELIESNTPVEDRSTARIKQISDWNLLETGFRKRELRHLKTEGYFVVPLEKR